MSWLFGSTATATKPNPPAKGLRVQNSAQGATRSLICGKVRIAGNLIWYGDFKSKAVQQTAEGGKGGGSQTGGTTYKYSANVAVGICAGPISSFSKVFDERGGVVDLSKFNISTFTGTYSQAAWSLLTAQHPTQALNYRGLAYVGFGPISLGQNPDMRNFTYEIVGTIKDGAPGITDADPRDWLDFLLTDPHEGIGFDPAMIDANDGYSSACKALGLLISQALVEQQEASKVLAELAQATNAEFRWSSGLLSIVPYYDETVTLGSISQADETHPIPATPFKITADHAGTYVANVGVIYQGSGLPLTRVSGKPAVGQYAVDQSTGIYTFAAADTGISVVISYTWAATASFVPNITPIYDLEDNDYLPGGEDGPIKVERKPRADVINNIRFEYLDRANSYNPVQLDRKDEAGIEVFGERPAERQGHMFALASAASLSAALQLNREQIVATYTFKLPPWAVLVDPLDLLTMTRSPMNLSRQGVRVIEIQEEEDGSLTFTAEEYLGTTSAPVYDSETPDGYIREINADPGGINDPIIFEPTAEQLGRSSIEIWGAVSGEDLSKWGGYNVYVSYDGGDNFALIGPQMRGPARMGVLSDDLPSVAEAPIGQTIDEANTLSVDLSESESELASGSTQDATSLATACYVGGEIVAYRDALLTSTSNYDLSYLVRGGFGSGIASHPAGTPFARLDMGICRVPFDPSMIGNTIYLKFQSYNIFGGGLQELSEVAAYPYTITGRALTSPLPTVANVRAQFTDGFQYIYWDDVVDFRSGVRYKIFRGDVFDGAQQVGDNAHAPFIAFGPGKYWIIAYAQPLPDLMVYSEDPVSIDITGNMIVKNLVFTSDQAPLGWPGAKTPGVVVDGDNLVLDGLTMSGNYEVDNTDWIDVGYLADLYLNVEWRGIGQAVGQNILDITDILSEPDILGVASTPNVTIKIQAAFATETTGDLYDSDDLYLEPDLYAGNPAWGEWVDYVPGVYHTRFVKLRAILETIDLAIRPVMIAFSFEASVLPRIDHYPGLSVPAGGLTVTFEPDLQATPAPFNGGTAVGGPHNHPLPFITWSGGNVAGVKMVVDALSLSEVTFHFVNAGGSSVDVTGVNLQAEGY